MGQPHVTKHLFVTGGVASSLGKGLTASSLGRLLISRGLRVTMQKLDPYLNVDPGTMNPFQHGEVFVTDDGAETDLDIGHYERFLDRNLHGSANVTTGQVYSRVVPYIGPSGELKTKPTQHSVAALRSIGIAPDAVVLRSDRPIPDGIKRKISLMCDVDLEAVVAAVDAPSIYDIPKVLYAEGLDSYVVRRLGLKSHDVKWGDWDDLLKIVHNPKHHVTVALVGKYIDLPDAYLSVSEALRAGGFANNAKVELKWVASDDCATPDGAKAALGDVDAICVPGGFGVRGIEGKLGALKFARENKIPTLGLCLGLQCMVIEAARNLAGIVDANSAEFSPESGVHVIATMEDQKSIVAGSGDMGASMRLGLYKADLIPGSIVAQTYGSKEVSERHRHRYEVNNKYKDQIAAAGLVFSGIYTKENLVEFVELPADVHPFYVGTQAHPELKSRPTRPHPLFIGLIASAIALKGKK